MEANQHMLNTLTPEQIAQKMSQIQVNITEMNIAGSIALTEMNKGKTTWRTEPQPSNKFSSLVQPQDPRATQSLVQRSISVVPSTETYDVLLEPQRIRTFNVKYMIPSGLF